MGYVGVIDNRTLQINCLSLFFNFLIRMQRWYDGDEWRGCSRHSARYMHLKYELYSSTSNSFVFNLLSRTREYNISKYLWSKPYVFLHDRSLVTAPPISRPQNLFVYIAFQRIEKLKCIACLTVRDYDEDEEDSFE